MGASNKSHSRALEARYYASHFLTKAICKAIYVRQLSTAHHTSEILATAIVATREMKYKYKYKIYTCDTGQTRNDMTNQTQLLTSTPTHSSATRSTIFWSAAAVPRSHATVTLDAANPRGQAPQQLRANTNTNTKYTCDTDCVGLDSAMSADTDVHTRMT